MAVDLHPTHERRSFAQIWVVAWPWLVFALGVAAIVVGGVFFSPA